VSVGSMDTALPVTINFFSVTLKFKSLHIDHSGRRIALLTVIVNPKQKSEMNILYCFYRRMTS